MNTVGAKVCQSSRPWRAHYNCMDASFDKDDLVKSLFCIDKVHDKARFNDKAKCRTLRKAAIEHARLLKFLLIKMPIFYKALKEAFTEKVLNWDLFNSNFAFEEIRRGTSKSGAKAMHNVGREIEFHLDNNLDAFSNQFRILSLIFQRKETPS